MFDLFLVSVSVALCVWLHCDVWLAFWPVSGVWLGAWPVSGVWLGCPTCLTCLWCVTGFLTCLVSDWVFGLSLLSDWVFDLSLVSDWVFDLFLVSGLSHMFDLSLVFDKVFDLSGVVPQVPSSSGSSSGWCCTGSSGPRARNTPRMKVRFFWPACRLVVPRATNPPNQVGFLNQNTRRTSHVSVYFKLTIPGPVARILSHWVEILHPHVRRLQTQKFKIPGPRI